MNLRVNPGGRSVPNPGPDIVDSPSVLSVRFGTDSAMTPNGRSSDHRNMPATQNPSSRLSPRPGGLKLRPSFRKKSFDWKNLYRKGKLLTASHSDGNKSGHSQRQNLISHRSKEAFCGLDVEGLHCPCQPKAGGQNFAAVGAQWRASPYWSRPLR